MEPFNHKSFRPPFVYYTAATLVPFLMLLTMLSNQFYVITMQAVKEENLRMADDMILTATYLALSTFMTLFAATVIAANSRSWKYDRASRNNSMLVALAVICAYATGFIASIANITLIRIFNRLIDLGQDKSWWIVIRYNIFEPGLLVYVIPACVLAVAGLVAVSLSTKTSVLRTRLLSIVGWVGLAALSYGLTFLIIFVYR